MITNDHIIQAAERHADKIGAKRDKYEFGSYSQRAIYEYITESFEAGAKWAIDRDREVFVKKFIDKNKLIEELEKRYESELYEPAAWHCGFYEAIEIVKKQYRSGN